MLVRGNIASVLSTAFTVRAKTSDDQCPFSKRKKEDTWLPPPPPSTADQESSPKASETEASQRVQPSRDPHDDPELARYLRPRVGRAPAPPLDTTSLDPSAQDLTDQLLDVSLSGPPPIPISPLPSLVTYAALLADMREGETPQSPPPPSETTVCVLLVA